MLYRHLKRSKGDVDQAFDSLKATAKFIHEDHFDLLTEHEPGYEPEKVRIVKKCVPAEWTGHDKHGRPVMFQRFGAANHDKYIELFTEQECLFNCKYLLADMLKRLRVLNQNPPPGADANIHQVVFINDMNHFGLSISTVLNNKGTAIFQKHSAMERQYFPGQIKNIFVINCSWYITMAWHAVKFIFAEETAAKFVFLGTDYLPELLKVMPASSIPVEYGGTGTIAVPPALTAAELSKLTYSRTGRRLSTELTSDIHKYRVEHENYNHRFDKDRLPVMHEGDEFHDAEEDHS
jgi:hypothetical protein